MSRIDDLIESYARFVDLPWPKTVAPPQRVWMAIYSPDDERRLRLHVPGFETATREADYDWDLIDISTSFEQWMANHDYREQYFANPELLSDLPSYMDSLVDDVVEQLQAKSTPRSVVGMLGAGSLYGLGEQVKLSALVDRIQDEIEGRLLVFFPGEHEGNNYRLLGARDGWNYMATPITAERS